MSRLHVATLPASLLCATLLCAMLAACGSGTPTGNAGDTPETTESTSASITGTVVYRERMMLPPGSRLQVQLVDTLLADTPRAVVAETTVEDAGASPIAFTLDYDPASIRDNGMYGLHASLYGPDNRLMFVTDTRHAVAPDSEAPVELLMRQVPAGEVATPSGPSADIRRSHWQCGELRVDSSFDPAIDATTLSWSGRTLVLPQTVTASGERYADEHGNEFRSKGDSALLILSGRPQVQCTSADSPSPWTEAAERGIAFRAVGNEPGWWVEVGSGAAPAMNAVLDYGERSLEIARAQPGGNGYSGSTADGVAVRLSIERRACEDGMSGEAFDARAELRVGDNTYTGCGAFLRD